MITSFPYCVWLAISVVLSCTGCKHSAGPRDEQDSVKTYFKPTADAGPDLQSRIGSYTILDGRASTRGGADTLFYSWTQAASNPYEVFLMDNESNQPVGFFKEGVYTFYLVVRNVQFNSDPDTLRVSVGSRTPCLIQDTALEMSIRLALHLPTEELTDQNLAKLDTLRPYYIQKTTTLAGLEHCTSLVTLLLGFQKISDVSPIAGLTNLQNLSFDGCRTIRDISPLANLTHLTYFSILDNIVSDISCVRNMVDLRYLNLNSNPVSDLSPLATLGSLTELVVTHAATSDISSLSHLTKLQHLMIISSNVTDVSSFAPLTELIYADLFDNRIENIDSVKTCTNLRRLLLSKNRIHDVSALKYLSRLEIVELYDNCVTNIQPLVDNDGIGNGDIVALRGNPLDSISVAQYIPLLRDRGVVVFF